ncbi:MAG TPA: hypothetical protein VFR34_11190 [Paracoccaceae bacterium]|nr:hypothetical protein [Paracoccaceae bacterium]
MSREVASPADRLAWAIARHAGELPGGTVFAASGSAQVGIRLAQALFGVRLALCGRGGAYDLAGIPALHARHWLFNRRPRAHVSLARVFETLSEPHSLLATPAQIDGAANANLSGIGDPSRPSVAFGGSRGLPDAQSVHFVLPAHGARQLVERVDFVSTAAATRAVPPFLFTPLCVMRWNPAAGRWRLIEIAPGNDAAALAARTGFAFETADDLRPMEDPPEAALALLPALDPLGIRALDFVAGRAEMLDAIARIYEAERALVGAGHDPAARRRGGKDERP